MNVLDQSNYNYYPNTAMELSVIAYELSIAIPLEVELNTNLKVCWGPAELTQDDIPYSKMFVANNAATGEYFVAIQGTNPFSIEAWTKEDFDIGTSQPFGDLPGNPPGVPADALISQGTFNGMSDLISLTDPSTGESLVDFLSGAAPKYIYVTGHSLGGTLTPTMFAYLNAMLYGAQPVHNMALWSFAGLTPGGTGFNTYFNNDVLPNDQNFLWRIQNSLDVAPLFWVSATEAKDIYQSYGLECELPWSAAIDVLFIEAIASGVDYAQPQAGLLLDGEFDNDKTTWFDQATHQHSHITYQALVSAYYPT